MNNEKYISEIVANVIKSINAGGEVKPAQNGNHLKGVFSSMTDALAAVSKAYTELKKYSVAQREETPGVGRQLFPGGQHARGHGGRRALRVAVRGRCNERQTRTLLRTV